MRPEKNEAADCKYLPEVDDTNAEWKYKCRMKEPEEKSSFKEIKTIAAKGR